MRRQTVQTTPINSQPAAQPPAAPDEPSNTTVILENTTVTGKIFGQGDVVIEGAVNGEIQVDGSVTVAKYGMVKGPIQAGTVNVAGSVEGNIMAGTRLQLEMTGSIRGDVTTCSFTIADGSFFDGRSHMTKLGEEPVFLYQA